MCNCFFFFAFFFAFLLRSFCFPVDRIVPRRIVYSFASSYQHSLARRHTHKHTYKYYRPNRINSTTKLSLFGKRFSTVHIISQNSFRYIGLLQSLNEVTTFWVEREFMRTFLTPLVRLNNFDFFLLSFSSIRGKSPFALGLMIFD